MSEEEASLTFFVVPLISTLYNNSFHERKRIKIGQLQINLPAHRFSYWIKIYGLAVDKFFDMTKPLTLRLNYASVKVNSFVERYDMFTLLMELGMN